MYITLLNPNQVKNDKILPKIDFKTKKMPERLLKKKHPA